MAILRVDWLEHNVTNITLVFDVFVIFVSSKFEKWSSNAAGHPGKMEGIARMGELMNVVSCTQNYTTREISPPSQKVSPSGSILTDQIETLLRPLLGRREQQLRAYLSIYKA